MASGPTGLSPRTFRTLRSPSHTAIVTELQSHTSSQHLHSFLNPGYHQGAPTGKYVGKRKGPQRTSVQYNLCFFTTFPPNCLAEPMITDHQSSSFVIVGLRTLELDGGRHISATPSVDCLASRSMCPGKPKVTPEKPRKQISKGSCLSSGDPSCPSPCL